MAKQTRSNETNKQKLSADCENCFGLCCVALAFSASSDFAFDKEEGIPCRNLQSDYRCGIHKNLRINGLKGCTVYECFGAGQKVSQVTFNGKGWRESTVVDTKEMFSVFPIMQQLHEMLYYLNEALHYKEARPIFKELEQMYHEIEQLTFLSPESMLDLYIPGHREKVNDLLKNTSKLVRNNIKNNNVKLKKKIYRRPDLIGMNLRGTNLRGVNLRGVLLIAADLRNADLKGADLIGADLRDADLRGANLAGSIFLTQVQVNSAKGDLNTTLPSSLNVPKHWDI